MTPPATATPKTTPADLDAWLDAEALKLLHLFVADFRDRFHAGARSNGVWTLAVKQGDAVSEFRARLETLKPLLRLDVRETPQWVVIGYTPASWDTPPPYPPQDHLFPVPLAPYNGTVYFEEAFGDRDVAIAYAVTHGTLPDNRRHYVVRAATAPCAEVMRISPAAVS